MTFTQRVRAWCRCAWFGHRYVWSHGDPGHYYGVFKCACGASRMEVH